MSLDIAKSCIIGKIYNARWVLERTIRDHGMQIDTERVKQASEFLKGSLQEIRQCETKDQLRGYEGRSSKTVF